MFIVITAPGLSSCHFPTLHLPLESPRRPTGQHAMRHCQYAQRNSRGWRRMLLANRRPCLSLMEEASLPLYCHTNAQSQFADVNIKEEISADSLPAGRGIINLMFSVNITRFCGGAASFVGVAALRRRIYRRQPSARFSDTRTSRHRPAKFD